MYAPYGAEHAAFYSKHFSIDYCPWHKEASLAKVDGSPGLWV